MLSDWIDGCAIALDCLVTGEPKSGQVDDKIFVQTAKVLVSGVEDGLLEKFRHRGEKPFDMPQQKSSVKIMWAVDQGYVIQVFFSRDHHSIPPG